MIPAQWTDMFVSQKDNQLSDNVATQTVATIDSLLSLRQKVDFLLKKATHNKENTDAGRTDDPPGPHGADTDRATALENIQQRYTVKTNCTAQ
jgi:hypothetical protein